MSTMSKTEARKRLKGVINGTWSDEYLTNILTALGVTTTPEPGTWHHTRAEGWPAYVDTDGDMQIIEPNGNIVTYYRDNTDDWPALDPATPPAPVTPTELSKAEVAELWNAPERNVVYMPGVVWEPFIERLTATVNAAIAKQGTGRTITKGQVHETLEDLINSEGDLDFYEARDSIIELLGDVVRD